jgi:ankyrin repeat protein
MPTRQRKNKVHKKRTFRMKGGVGEEDVKNPMHSNTYTDQLYTGEKNMQQSTFVNSLYDLIRNSKQTIGGSQTEVQPHINKIIDEMSVEELNKKDYFGNYILIVAITFDNVATVKKLLDKGVNPNVLDRENKTALEIAIQKNNTEIIKMLIEKREAKGEKREAKGGKRNKKRNRTIKRKKNQ